MGMAAVLEKDIQLDQEEEQEPSRLNTTRYQR